MARILVISGDILPYPGLPTTGAGLRAWGLGQGLKAKGHQVIMAMPEHALSLGQQGVSAFDGCLYRDRALAALIERQQPEVVIVQHWRLANFLPADLETPVVIDLHGPLLLEVLFQEHPAFATLQQDKLTALQRADFFTCAGEKQRYYFESWLLMAGVDLRQDVLRVIPVSLSPDLPAHASCGDLTFVYGGVFLPWQDPTQGLMTLLDHLDARQCGQLKFFGGNHPLTPMVSQTFTRLIAELRRRPRVQMHPFIPRAQLIQEYCRAHVAIDLMQRNVERELAFTTRTVEYLWCGLPVIYNNYAELADLIQRYQAGWTIDPQDQEAITAVLNEILDHPEELTTRGRNAQRLVRECLTWDHTIAPLDAFCRAPVKRPGTIRLTARERQSLRQHAKAYQEKLWFYLRHEGPGNVFKRAWRKFV